MPGCACDLSIQFLRSAILPANLLVSAISSEAPQNPNLGKSPNLSPGAQTGLQPWRLCAPSEFSAICAHCPANLCSFWGGAAGVPKSILARSEEKSTGKSKFVNSFQLFAPFGSALATRFPFQLFVPARQPGRISRLCRARHNRLYAEYRIMPSKSRRATAGRGFGATCTRHN